jgi:hypothetical protein
MSIMFPPSKKKLAKAQFSIDNKARQRRVGSESSLKTSEMFLNSNLSLLKDYNDSLEYIEKNKSKFLADSKQQFNWKYKNENYTYILLIDENLGIPYGYELTINGQLVQIVDAYDVRVSHFDTCYQTKDKKIDKIAEEFLNSMKKDKHYIHSDSHKCILGMKAVDKELQKFKMSYFDMELNNIDDLIICFKMQIKSSSAQTPSMQAERDKYHAFYLQNTADIAKYEKELDKLNGSNQLSLVLAKMVGDKRALSKLDLINLVRPDRCIFAWIVLIIELIGIAIGLVIAAFVFAFAFAKSK